MLTCTTTYDATHSVSQIVNSNQKQLSFNTFAAILWNLVQFGWSNKCKDFLKLDTFPPVSASVHTNGILQFILLNINILIVYRFRCIALRIYKILSQHANPLKLTDCGNLHCLQTIYKSTIVQTIQDTPLW